MHKRCNLTRCVVRCVVHEHCRVSRAGQIKGGSMARGRRLVGRSSTHTNPRCA